MKTKSDSVLTAAAVAVTACVAAMSGYLFFTDVGHRWAYAVAVATMAVAWFARRFGSSPRNVTTSIVLAGALLSLALGTKALGFLGWAAGSDIAVRLNGIMAGAALVVLSNAIPKRMSSASGLAMRRAVGRAFVIGGFGYACAWLVLPLRFADTVAMVIVLACFVVAAASYISWHRSGDRSVS
jgi:hypothetical protein